MVKVMPKKDFKCRFNAHLIDLKSGKESEVPKVLLQNLKTEKVI